jgi:hypothetical protein
VRVAPAIAARQFRTTLTTGKLKALDATQKESGENIPKISKCQSFLVPGSRLWAWRHSRRIPAHTVFMGTVLIADHDGFRTHSSLKELSWFELLSKT